MADAVSEQRLAALRRRWEQERSATASMPLAEEFRRLGRYREAIEVLETALAVQKHHTALQVALSRCRLEAGEPRAAIEALHDVLRRDPLQLVANQLMIESLIAAGETGTAEDRLLAYRAMNGRDPKISDWTRRLAAIEREGLASAAAAGAAAPPLAPLARPAPAALVTALPVPLETESLFELSVDAMAPTEASRSGSLLPDLASAETLEFGETLFPELGTDPTLENFVANLRAGWRSIAGEQAESDEMAFDQPALEQPRATPAGFLLDSPLQEAPAAFSPSWDFDATTKPEASETDKPAETPPESAATVTLGELYLKQGHAQEAERIFEDVLARDPANLAAAEGLRALREALERPVEPPAAVAAETAGDLFAESVERVEEVLVIEEELAEDEASSLLTTSGAYALVVTEEARSAAVLEPAALDRASIRRVIAFLERYVLAARRLRSDSVR